MAKRLIALFLICMPLSAFAASGKHIHLDKMEPDPTNYASLQEGMKTFVNYCMGCHSAQYQRYQRAAEDLKIPQQLMEQYLILGDHKFGDQMTIAMNPEDAKNWFGALPPDLTLSAKLRGTDWLYTYLRTFYTDYERPLGVNNLVYPAVGMPNVLAELQGEQKFMCRQMPVLIKDKWPKIDPETARPLTAEKCGVLGVVEGSGQLTEAEFDEVIYDLTNFLAYTADPNRLVSERIGTYVLIFLFFFTILLYSLKREYWRDVH